MVTIPTSTTFRRLLEVQRLLEGGAYFNVGTQKSGAC